MDIYATGGLVLAFVYFLTGILKRYINTRYVPLIPILLTPLAGGIYAYFTGLPVMDAILKGFGIGAGAIATHETIDHTIKGKSSDDTSVGTTL